MLLHNTTGTGGGSLLQALDAEAGVALAAAGRGLQRAARRCSTRPGPGRHPSGGRRRCLARTAGLGSWRTSVGSACGVGSLLLHLAGAAARREADSGNFPRPAGWGMKTLGTAGCRIVRANPKCPALSRWGAAPTFDGRAQATEMLLHHRGPGSDCWENVRDFGRMETIEIGAVELPSSEARRRASSTGSSAPWPNRNERFCRRLTTIRQRDVDGGRASPLSPLIRRVDPREPFVLCSWGGYDLTQFRIDCADTAWRCRRRSSGTSTSRRNSPASRCQGCGMEKGWLTPGYR